MMTTTLQRSRLRSELHVRAQIRVEPSHSFLFFISNEGERS
jgi:hypothetical protein